MSQRDSQNRLSILEKLDFESPEDRRIALFTLNDYFGAVFDEVGQKLDFRTSDYGTSVGHQWKKASTRLERIESINIPEEYNTTLHTISELRGDYAHDFGDFPPADSIESAQEVAPEWACWIREAAEKYEKYQESLTATQALLQVGDRALNHDLKNWLGHPPHISEKAKDLKERSDKIQKHLNLYADDEEITKELVEVISQALKWEREKKRFEDEAKIWMENKEKQKEMEIKSTNTYNFIVVEEAGEYDRITVVKHDIRQPEDTYSFTISNCPINEEKRNYLRSLEVNDEVQLWIRRQKYRNKDGFFDYDTIIQDIELE